MNYSFYAIHWIHYIDNKINWTDDSLYYSLEKPFNVEAMKEFVRMQIVKDPLAFISIENIKEISREKFEQFGGNCMN